MQTNDLNLDKNIFKAYDIRGIFGKNLTPEITFYIGKAIAIQVKANQQNSINIGYDGRLSSPILYQALSNGILSENINIINLGMVTTPITYFANYYSEDKLKKLGIVANSSVMITGSHNPKDYNGFKIVINNHTLYGVEIEKLYKICLEQLALAKLDKPETKNISKIYNLDITVAYKEAIIKNIKIKRKLKIALDAGNGIAGKYAPQILQDLGCEIIPLFCKVDGNFPNHHPDPAHIDNLNDLIQVVQQQNCDFGIAFDGDGDRLGVVSNTGQIIFPDRQMILYAFDVLKHNPQANIVFDVKCSTNLPKFIKKNNGIALMYKTGHSLIKAYMKQQNAKLGGEMSGHIFFADRWYGFDDGIYTAARLIEILSYTQNPSLTLNNLPNTYSTPEIIIDCSKINNQQNLAIYPCKIIEDFKKYVHQHHNTIFKNLHINYIDGVRIDFNNGFGLIRASNTTPSLVLRFEGSCALDLEYIKNIFICGLTEIAPSLILNYNF